MADCNAGSHVGCTGFDVLWQLPVDAVVTVVMDVIAAVDTAGAAGAADAADVADAAGDVDWS